MTAGTTVFSISLTGFSHAAPDDFPSSQSSLLMSENRWLIIEAMLANRDGTIRRVEDET
tara:strand:+ start:968 stop:1144 length:177 start_codon:yes stop_codon:yes gene_type:complete